MRWVPATARSPSTIRSASRGARRRRRTEPILRRLLPRRRRRRAGHRGARAHRPGAGRGARGARGALPRGRAAGPLLLADDGARRRHRRSQRRQHAQRAADPGELRPAQRPRRPQRPARAGLHLLLVGQPARPVLLPPARKMVAGQVRPPRLDLANEDLVRAHVHAVWLAETRQESWPLAQRHPRRRRASRPRSS